MKLANLKRKFSGKSSYLVIGLMALLGVVVVWRIFAAVAQGEIYTPNGTVNVKPGESFSVEVKLNTNGEPISYVQTALSYPTDKMTLTNIDYSTSAFPLEVKSSTTAGNIVISRGPTLGTAPVSGDVTVARLNFVASSSATGSAVVSLDYANSLVLSNNSNSNTLPNSSGSLALANIAFLSNPGPANATLSLDPATQSVKAGDDVALTLQLNTGGDEVNVAQTYVTYPKDKLQYVSTQAGAAFDTEAAPTVDNNGTIELARYSSPQGPGANGSTLAIATFHFKALSVTATADVTIGNNSILARKSDNQNVLHFINNAAVGISVDPPNPQTKAVLYLTPPTQSVKGGNNFSVQLRVNTNGDPVNVVQTSISYSSDLISYVSVTPSTEFNGEGPSAGGPGSFSITRFVMGGQQPVTGDVLVATLNFSARDGVNGNANIDIATDSIVARATDNQNTLSQVTGAVVGVSANGSTKPPAPPKPKPTQAQGPKPRPATVNAPSTSVITESFSGTGSTSTSTNQGSAGSYSVKLTLKQTNGNPIVNKRIDIVAGSTVYSGVTDSQGQVVYRNLKAGEYQIKSRDFNKLDPSKITVADDTANPTQSFEVTASSTLGSTSKWLIILLLVLLIGGGLAALWWVLFGKHNKNTPTKPTAVSRASASEQPASPSTSSTDSKSQVFYPKQK